MHSEHAASPNILLVTLDQFRADCLSCAGHPVVRTPALDHLAANGLRLGRHYSQAAPCSPGRAALYTGTYQMNNRVVANGTPLDSRLDNIALAARRAGYTPALFGYTDQGVDPRFVTDPGDPRLSTYEGVLPGFDPVLDMSGWQLPWLQWLNGHGYDFPDPISALHLEHERPAELSTSTFLTDAFLDWLGDQREPWFAHLSYLRPHPPYSAAGEFSTMYDPASCPAPLPLPAARHRLLDVLLQSPAAAPTDPAEVAHVQAQYFGMISEVDAQLARVWAALVEHVAWDDTVIVVTSDHGEQLGDQGLVQKAGFYESSYAVLGIVRDPRCSFVGVTDEFTENVDIMPTLCEAMGCAVPAQCDGFPLTPFIGGERPDRWRDAAHYEWDWRDALIPPWRPPLAVGPPAGTAEPGGAAQSRSGLRALRRRLVALLRPDRRPDVADRGDRPFGRARRSRGDVELALAQPRSHHDRDVAARRRHRSPSATFGCTSRQLMIGPPAAGG